MKNQTKRALLSSVLALVLCASMLVGTTFAWFTDSVTSADNKIATGNLDVELKLWTSANESVDISESSDPIFGEGSLAQNNNADTLWEPGKTQVAYLSIKNAGSLDLKYSVALVVTALSGANLAEVMEYAVIPGATYGTVDEAWDATAAQTIENAPGINTQATDVELASGAEHFFALAIHMNETAGNEYMNSSITFDIKVVATQLASESDAFGNTYDADAEYDDIGFAFNSKELETNADNTTEVELRNENDTKVATVKVPNNALNDGTESVDVVMKKTEQTANITLTTSEKAESYDISVSNVKENNAEPIEVSVRLPEGLDPDTVKVYHYDDLVQGSRYNPNTGYVTFEVTDFSPFTFVYDVEAEYVAPEVPEDEEGNAIYPTAIVTPYTDTENIEWGNYGQWSPTEGLEANLEAAFQFQSPTGDAAMMDVYENWYCDYYVSLDRDLGANQIFLGGNYGSFGWIGFHNGDVTLKANEELPLLGSVTNAPWTYYDIVSLVDTFICGVGDVNDALSGATFTVHLRLTNPADETEFYNVNTITYTFQ